MVLVLIFVPLGAYLITSSIPKNTRSVDLVIAPQEVTMTEDGKEQTVSSDQKIRLSLGAHKLVFSKGNFNTVTKEVTVTAKEPERILVFLEPQNESAEQELNQEVNQIALQGISDLEHLKDENFYSLNPIAARLPIDNPLTKIKYEIDPEDPSGNTIILVVDAFPGYRHVAITRIKNAGFDPTTFNIKFINHTNPFAL